MLNPFRYRGYYYDNETELYYLQSRYYDPEVGRFINCDDVNYIGVTESEVSYNPFAYCENDPVNASDPYGRLPISLLPQKWYIKFLRKLIGTEMTNKRTIRSISALGISISLSQLVSCKIRPDAFFSVSKSSISASLGGLSFSMSGLSVSLHTEFEYKGVSLEGFIGISKKEIEFGLVSSQYLRCRYGKYSVGLELAIRISMRTVAAMTTTVVAANLLLPQLVPVFTKAAIVITKLVSATRINAKALLTPLIAVVWRAYA